MWFTLALFSASVFGWEYDHYYPFGENRNCKEDSRLSRMFDIPHAALPFEQSPEKSTCCKFQDTVVSATINPPSDVELNELSVFFGQIIWSHDPARTPTDSSKKIKLTCQDGREVEMSSLETRSNGVVNALTACIDASVVYGSNEDVKTTLTERTFPYVTLSKRLKGTCSAAMCQVEIDNPFRFDLNNMFSAGDIRVNENPALSSMHILWANRHNHHVNRYRKMHYGASDEDIFTMARARVIAEIQHSAKEYVKALIGEEVEYQAYRAKDNQEVRLFMEFSHCINRIQHSQLRRTLMAKTETGETETQNLLNLFFRTDWIRKFGIGPVIRGALSRTSLNVGMHFNPDLVEGEGNRAPNLALFDCNRGRELGFANYAAIRKELFGETITSWDDITTDAAVQVQLKDIYGDDLEHIDLFVGGLAETHLPGAGVGKTFKSIFIRQLEEMMYHDESWYERPHVERPISYEEVEQVKNLKFSDILLESGDIDCVPEHAFFVESSSNPLKCRSFSC